jgi:excisionase family DNA binding protein
VSARYLTLREAAAQVSTPTETVRYWVHVGKLRAFKPGRQVLIREDDLAALVESSEIGALREAKAKKVRKARAA